MVGRGFFWVSLLSLMFVLSGCENSADNIFVFKSTVKVTYDGRPIAAETILRKKVYYKADVFGEATVIELGGGKRAYLLLADRARAKGGSGPQINRRAVYWAFRSYINPENKRLSAKERDLRMRAIPIGMSAQYFYKTAIRPPNSVYNYPLVVAFKDETDPASVFLVETEKPIILFGKKFDFEGMFIERMAPDTPLTDKLVKVLPWVDLNHEHWRGKLAVLDQKSKMRPMSEATFGSKIPIIAFERRK